MECKHKKRCIDYPEKCNDCGQMSDIYNHYPLLKTRDLVEVVRCKDCKYITHLMGKAPFRFYACSHNKGLGDNVRENDFCSYGERKEGADFLQKKMNIKKVGGE